MSDKELKRFFRGKKWNKKQQKELEKQGKSPIILNKLPKVCKSYMSNVNQLSFTEMSKICAVDKKDLGKPNTKSGQERQREACKDKTIVEVLDEK